MTWTLRDNSFDRTTIGAAGAYKTANSNNGYHLATALPGGTANRTVTVTPSYQTGSLGQFYYPASGAAGTITYELVDRGSRTASAARLFHHTTKTAHSSKDTMSVDIGFHYAATTSNKIPTAMETVWRTGSRTSTATGAPPAKRSDSTTPTATAMASATCRNTNFSGMSW